MGKFKTINRKKLKKTLLLTLNTSMKKIILLCLLLVSIFNIQAQTLNGSQQFNVSTCFTSVDWEVSYSFQMLPEGVAIQFYNPRITVSPSSDYYTQGHRYSKQNLGLSSWPNENQNPQNMVISFQVSHIEGYANFFNSQPCTNGKFAPTIVLRKANVKNWEDISINSFRVISTQRMMYNNIGSIEVDNLIEAKKNNNSSNVSNSNSNNSATQTSTTINPNDPNPMTNGTNGNYQAPKSDFQQNYETGQQIANVTTPLINDWVNNIQQRRDAEQKRAQEEAAQKKAKGENDLNKTIDAYLTDANNGNEEARLHLVGVANLYGMKYLTSYDYMLEKSTQWVLDAAKNKNQFAMDIIGFGVIDIRILRKYGINSEATKYGLDYLQGLILLEESAKLGSIDAMMTLGNYYDRKDKLLGSDPDKAFYWYSEAAALGSTSAMNKLGMIYRYRRINGVKYKVEQNDTIAFNWFVKSVNTIEESKTKFCIYNYYGGSGSFQIFSCKELAIMYEKGIGCKADKEIALKLRSEYENYFK
jgi:TPR repeat protein